MINNLSQLKKAINNGQSFKILKHYIHPEYTGQVRKPNKIQTNGFYSIVENEPNNPLNTVNYGKGSWVEYGKASEWTFDNGVCKFAYRGKPVWEIQFVE